MRKIKVALVNTDKKKSKVLQEGKFQLVLLELPWGWEFFFSLNLYNNHSRSIHDILDKIAGHDWTWEHSEFYPDFIWMRNIKEMSEIDASRIYVELGVEFEKKDLRERFIPPPSPQKPDQIDFKKLAANDRD